MPPLRTYHLFISHAWRYHDPYQRLTNLLRATPYFRFSNFSVPRHDGFGRMTKPQLKEQLERQILPAGCVLVLSGLYVSYSEWIQFEIDFAKRKRKPIIGVMPRGSQRLPAAVSSAANTIVGWNTASIVKAIRAYSL